MHRSVSEPIARHLGVAADGHLHFFFMLLLFEKKIGDLMTGLLVADDNELPRLAIASRRRPAGTIEYFPNCFIGNVSILFITADAPAVGSELAQLVDVQHVSSIAQVGLALPRFSLSS